LLAHFGAAPLADVVPQWRIEDSGGHVVANGEWNPRAVPIGKGIALGKVSFALSQLPAPAVYKLIVGLRGTQFENDWKFWVYLAQVSDAVPQDVMVTRAWPQAEARLAAGGKVLLQPETKDLDSSDPKMPTVPIFWNRVMNASSAWFVGLWCDGNHPALAGFPTEDNCDWQWVDVARDARALNLDTLPRELQPIVQAIDEWSRNEKLGLVYECKVGTGRLLVCSVDLGGARPGAKSLRRSLLDYMASERFQPATTIAAEDLRKQWVSTRSGHFVDVGATQPVRPAAPEVDAPPGVAAPATRP